MAMACLDRAIATPAGPWGEPTRPDQGLKDQSDHEQWMWGNGRV